MRRLFAILILLAGWPAAGARADDSAMPSASELGRAFRSLLLPNLPNPLVEKNSNWGHQKMETVGVNWKKTGGLLRPEVVKGLRNDGLWRKIAVSADTPEQSLQLLIRDVQVPEAGRLTFQMQLQLPVRLKFEQQLWRSGTRLYSGETRARCKVVLQLKCESTSRFDKKPGCILPDIVMRLRVLEAKLNYTDFKVEHTAGFGGDLAKIIGDAVHDMIKGLKPSLERDLLDKANAAIVKAGDTKEVRIGLSKMFDKK